MSNGSLENLRVIDLSTVIAGSIGSSMLADHGADVLKIENPSTGDPARHLQPCKNSLSLWHKVAGRNKKALTLKLSSPEGAEILLRLVADTDILIENFRPGTLEKWGLGWEQLKKVNPQLVMVRISGYGQDGPYSSRPGFGTIAEAMAGLPIRCGMPNGQPMLSPISLADDVTGLFAAFSALFAIFNRDHETRKGQVIDIALHESLFRIIEDQIPVYDQTGEMPQKIGNRVPFGAPRGVFESKDSKWIAISAASDRTAVRLLTVIGGAVLAMDPRYATSELRIKHADELEDYLNRWIGERTQDEVLEIFEREDVIAGPLYDVEQILSDPHYVYRNSILTVDDEDFGPMRVPGVVPKFSETPGKVRHLSASLG